jgi:plastocyanin
MSHRRLAIVAALVVAVFAATASFAFAATKSVGVKQSGSKFSFTPKTLSIKKGDTVKWSWSGSTPHNVSGKGFKSKSGTKVTYSHKFTKAGKFTVVCTFHKALGQTMTIKVS